MPDFLLLALVAGIGIALIAAPLGAFIVWQRLAYFGDTLAHASLLGVAFGLLLTVNIQLAIMLCSLFIAVLLVFWQHQKQLPNDTLLGILSHSTLALGLVLVSVFDSGRIDLSAYLLGDLLSTDVNDVITIYILLIIVALTIWRYWHALLSMIVNEPLAIVEGIPVKKMRFLFICLLALTIAMAIKMVGVLLITALLIIPAAAARYLSSSPEKMVLWAGVFGCLSVMGGLYSSLLWDTPAGPSIVVCSSLLFLLSLSRSSFPSS
ncbi:Zinc ABC transporter, inner membrane permease protein ZnuB [gamma proteobacterium IMCC1989]|nr:Zinc ABC transporter, inner membrane permease protein ZnuB [gamma proteobacterium IMCC1989]